MKTKLFVIVFLLFSVYCSAQNLLPGSLLADANDEQTIRSWLGTNATGTLLYRKSIHGASAATFHSRCDNKGPTLVLIKYPATNTVFGGYATVSWNGNLSSYSTAPGSFLYNLTTNTKIALSQYSNYNQYALFNYPSYGPTFGGGHDIWINGDMNGGYAWGGYSYKCNDNSSYPSESERLACRTQLVGTDNSSLYFVGEIGEIEVYQVDITGASTTYYQDADGDTYGNPGQVIFATSPPEGYVTNNTDCDDTKSTVHPGAAEICGNGIDDDCDGLIDESDLAATSSASSILCNNGTANIIVAATGGALPYTGTGTYNRQAGYYTFTVTDANICSATTSVTITQPDALVTDVIADPILCAHQQSVLHVSATGGTLPYSGTGDFPVGSGTYNPVVTDANGCTSTFEVILNDQVELSATAYSDIIPCNGGTATVHVSASGGAIPYTGTGDYEVTAGDYQYTVTDFYGCSSTVQWTVTENTQPVPPPIAAGTTICRYSNASLFAYGTGTLGWYDAPVGGNWLGGGSNYITGTIREQTTFYVQDSTCAASERTPVVVDVIYPMLSIVASSTEVCEGTPVTLTGSGAILYSWNNGVMNGEPFVPQYTSIYVFTGSDESGCDGRAEIEITVNPKFSINASAGANGSISPDSDTAICKGENVVFSITPNTGYLIADVLVDGNSVGAVSSYTFSNVNSVHTISANFASVCNQPAISASVTNVPCATGSNGAINLTVTGDDGPFMFEWTKTSGGFSASSEDISGLTEGEYNVTVTNAAGCYTIQSYMVTQPSDILSASAQQGLPLYCYGGTTDVTVTASGGTAPYTGEGIYQIGGGLQNFTVTDANGCVSAASLNIQSPAPVVAEAISEGIACAGYAGTVHVSATGGNGFYIGTGDFTVNAGGNYQFTVTDANGCMGTVDIDVTEPTFLTPSVSAIPVACKGDLTTVTVSATGGTAPYIGVGSFQSYAGSQLFTVQDSKGCTNTAYIEIQQPEQLTVNASALDLLCKNGSASVIVNAFGGTVPYSGTGNFSVSQLGYKDFTVTDANGCSNTQTVEIKAGEFLSVSATADEIFCNGTMATVNISATGGTSPYTGIGLFTQAAGTTTYRVSDFSGCTDSVNVTLSQPQSLDVMVSQTNPITCKGGTTVINITATGGTTPYTGIGNITVSAGTRLLTVSDAAGCSKTISVTIADGTGTAPARPGTITGPIANICNGIFSYSVTAVASATSYNWQLPPGFTILQNNGRSVNVSAPANFIGSGTISVSAVNSCGTSAARTLTVFAVAPNPSAYITGPASVASGAVVNFSLPSSPGYTYTWVVPAGATIQSGQGTNKVKVKWGTSSGSIKVTISNLCGSSPQGQKQVTVSAAVIAATGDQSSNGVAENSSLHLYPNPAKNRVMLEYTVDKPENYQLLIQDITGKKLQVQSGKWVKGKNLLQLNIASLANGMYTVTIVGGKETVTQKLIKE